MDRVLLEKLTVAKVLRNSELLWNPKFYYRINNSPPLTLIPSQMNPIRTTSSYFYKIHSIYIR
jgi:hypothetical protein